MGVRAPVQTGGAILAAVLLAAFNLRIAIVSTGPVIDQIRADTMMSSAVAGTLTTIPFLCMGLFAFVGAPLIHRYGTKRVIAIGLTLILVGTLLRAVMPSAIGILGVTFAIGVGVALIGVALPVVVKLHFSDRPGAATGAYVASLSLGIAIVGVALVPLAELLGGWREAFAVSAIPALIALVLWLIAVNRGTGITSPSERPGEAGRLTESLSFRARFGSKLPGRAVVMLAAVFGLQALCFAAMVGWAPAVYAQGGWSEKTAAIATTIIGLMNIVGSLTVPRLSDGGDRRKWLATTLVFQTAGILGLAIFGTTGGWLWMVLFGFGNGATFALLLVLPIDLCEEVGTVADVTMWMLGMGYLLAATGPVVVGALRDLSSDFGPGLAVLTAVGVLTAILALILPRKIAADEVTRARRRTDDDPEAPVSALS